MGQRSMLRKHHSTHTVRSLRNLDSSPASHRKTESLRTRATEVQCTLTVHSDFVRSVAYSPDGKHIVSGSDDRTVKVWDSQTGKEVNVLFCHRPYRLLLRGLC